MGLGGVAIATLPSVICAKLMFSDGLGGYFITISSIKVSPKQYNIPYKANACLILKKLDTLFFRQYKYCLMNLCV